jgi:MoaA/NifB/PqqE/SkfB family radical SAM enzyme
MELPIYEPAKPPASSPASGFKGWIPCISFGGSEGFSNILFQPRKLLRWLALVIRHIWRKRQYLTLLKVLNILGVTIQHRLKTEYVLGRPFQVSIEPTNVCPTKCALCPTGQRFHGREKGTICFEEYTRLIDRCKRWTYTLNLFQWGDPLNAPRIYDMIRYAHDASIHTHISTTLTAFNGKPETAEALVASGLDLLSCSFHGATDETFFRYQGNHRFAEMVEKIRVIVAARNRMGSATPQVQMHFVVMKSNEHQMEQFSALARGLGCVPVFSPPSLNLRFLKLDRELRPLPINAEQLEEKVKARTEAWLPDNPLYVIEPYRRIKSGEARYQDFGGEKISDCEWPWKAVVVTWDRKVSVCCGSWSPAQDYGDLSSKSWGQVWNSATYREARRSFKHPVKDAGAGRAACVSCPGAML